MPKTNIDYANTVMYKIVCKDETIKDVYVGHTTNFVKRKYQHKKLCGSMCIYSDKLYNFIKKNGGWDNWNMIELEMYPCCNLKEALIRERYWIDNEKATLNTVKPCIQSDAPLSKEEYLKQKIECQRKALANLELGKKLRREKQNEYYHANLEQERERNKQKQFNHYHNVKKPQNDIIKAYLILEELKTSNPEYLEEIKEFFIAN